MRKICALAVALAFTPGFALAQQNYHAQQPSNPPQQTPQTQQMPQTQPASSQGQVSAASQNLQTQIQTAFWKDPALSNVTASVTDDQIKLSGTVATQADKDKASRNVESSGGRKIVDNINVSSSQNLPPRPATIKPTPAAH